MIKHSARVITSLVTASTVLFLVSTPAYAQENPAGQKAFDTGPVGVNQLSASPGPNPGQVTLSWKQVKADINNYNLVYGTEPNKFTYGALNVAGGAAVGKTISFTVGFLSPGTPYYFAISPIKGGKAQYISFQVSAQALPGVVTLPPVPAAGAVGAVPTVALTSIPADDLASKQDLKSIKSKGVGRHGLSVKKGGKPGEVILEWKQAYNNVDNYDIVYGTEPGKPQYGAQNIGKIEKFAVKGLDPNKQYYFSLVPKKGGRAQYITQQVSTAGAEVAKAEEIKQAGGQPSTAAPSAAGGAPGAPAVGIPGVKVNVGTSGQAGQSAQPAGGGSQKQESKSESKPAESKKAPAPKKKSKVKGAATIQTLLQLLFSR